MTTNHSNCDHPATKSARAKCRREAAQAPAADALIRAINAWHALLARTPECLGWNAEENADGKRETVGVDEIANPFI